MATRARLMIYSTLEMTLPFIEWKVMRQLDALDALFGSSHILHDLNGGEYR